MVQDTFDEDGWVLVDRPRDESFIKLDVGDELVARFVGSKPNLNFKDEKIHVFEDLDTDEKRQLNGTTDLDRWMEGVEPGCRVRIVRLKDKKLPSVGGVPRKPLQVYKVWKKEEGK